MKKLNTSRKCPICGSKFIHNEYWIESIRCEEYDKCPKCTYGENFEYGHYYVAFYKHEFIWSYYTSWNELRRIQKKLDKALFMAKRNYKKGLKSKYLRENPIKITEIY